MRGICPGVPTHSQTGNSLTVWFSSFFLIVQIYFSSIPLISLFKLAKKVFNIFPLVFRIKTGLWNIPSKDRQLKLFTYQVYIPCTWLV